MDDLEFIERLKNGEDSAYETLVQTYQKKIYNLALQTCKNPEDAGDVTQDVFIRIYRSITSFEGKSSLSTWIFRVASNVCIDFARKNKRMKLISLSPSNEEDDISEYDFPDLSNEPQALLERQETMDAVRNALLSLNYEHREILTLRDINGLSYAEIAEILDLNEGTVKSRIARARAKLSSMLLRDGNIPVFASSNQTKEKKNGKEHNPGRRG